MRPNATKDILSWASTVVGVIPGFAIFLAGFWILPEFSKTIFAGLVETTCALIVLLTWLNREKLSGRSIGWYTSASIICWALLIIFIFTYDWVYSSCFIPQGTRSTPGFKPLWLSDELISFLKQQDNLSDPSVPLIDQYFDQNGPGPTRADIKHLSYASYILTRTIVYVLYLLVFVSLTLSFVLPWIKYEKLASTRALKDEKRAKA